MTLQTFTEATAKAAGSALPALGGAPLWLVVAIAIYFYGAGPANDWLAFARKLRGESLVQED